MQQQIASKKLVLLSYCEDKTSMQELEFEILQTVLHHPGKAGQKMIVQPVKLFSAIFTILLFAGNSFAQTAEAAKHEDRHSGYYYPAPQTSETYSSNMPVMKGVTKKSRIGFVVGITELQLKHAFAPDFIMFAKGEEAEKLIIIVVDQNRFQTLYQLRALMAFASTQARTSPLFAKTGMLEELTFLDLCHIAGFGQVTISNGNNISHQISLK